MAEGRAADPIKLTADLVARGVALAQAGRWPEALEHFQHSLAIAPASAAVWSNAAFALRTLGRTGEAAEAIARAVAIDASIADAWNIYGLVEQDRRDFAAARSHFRHALTLNPRFPQAWMNLGNSEQALGNAAAAIEAYEKALAMDPRLPEIHYNLGLLQSNAMGEIERAIAHYRQAIELAPDFALAHHNLAHCLFLLGRFDQAWREHQWRSPRRGYAGTPRLAQQPAELACEDLAGERFLVLAEQGLGDILFYLRYAPALRARGAMLDFAGDPRLHPMLARTGLFERFAANAAEAGGQTTELLAGDLPLAVTPPGHSIEVAPPLALTADRDRIAAARRRLQALGKGPYVAIAWRAGEPKTGLNETLYKTVPLDLLGAALRHLDATFISVQRDPGPDETPALSSALGHPVHDLSSVNRDLEDTLAWMEAVDLYVGVSSTNVHLRASLGRDAHVLVPFPPEWRWMAQGASPWFPAMRVYRQQASREWQPALDRLAADLRRDLDTRSR